MTIMTCQCGATFEAVDLSDLFGDALNHYSCDSCYLATQEAGRMAASKVSAESQDFVNSNE